MAQLYWPFDPSLINYGFGYPPGYGGFHNGIDFPVAQGTELRATASGIVRNNNAGQVDGAGVDITTDDGWLVRMWHVSKFLVPNGSRVNAGDVVALSGGARGSWGAGNSTGPHLHWGVAIGRRGNDYNWIDPQKVSPPVVKFDIEPINLGDVLDMRLVKTTDGASYIITANRIEWVRSPGDAELLQRVLESNPSNPAVFFKEQLDALQPYFRETPVGSVTATIDPRVIAKAVNDDAARRLQS